MSHFYFSKIKPQYYDSISSYRKELLDCGSHFDGCSQLENYDDIEKWHLNCNLFENVDTVPPGYSLGFQYLYLCDDEVIGMVNLRPFAESHPYLSLYGGHIGYNIRPSRRKQGIGSMMLRDFLLICLNDYHLDKVLITCYKDNEGSRRIILNNGGKYEKDIYYPADNTYLERYWISLQ